MWEFLLLYIVFTSRDLFKKSYLEEELSKEENEY